MIEISRILEIIEHAFPKRTAMDGDRIGLQVQSGNHSLNSILFCLDVNKQVIDQAVNEGFDCIISFHPLIFSPLMNIIDSDRVGHLTSELIRNRITLISIHTNFDYYRFGSSYEFSKRIGFEPNGFLELHPNFQEYGIGSVIDLNDSILLDTLLDKISAVTNSPLRYNPTPTININKIAIVCGSGISFLNSALRIGADVYITADIKYHSFHEVNSRLCLIDPGHYEMEQFVPFALMNFFKNTLNGLTDFKLMTSTALTNPVRYFPKNNFESEQTFYLNNTLV